MYTVKRQCTTALKLMQQNNVLAACKPSVRQELNVFNFNRDQIKQYAHSYSTTASPIHRPIKKLMVANRGKY
jgi:hypothetical protein